MQLTVVHMYTYKRPVIFNYRLHAMNFVTVDSHLLIEFTFQT